LRSSHHLLFQAGSHNTAKLGRKRKVSLGIRDPWISGGKDKMELGGTEQFDCIAHSSVLSHTIPAYPLPVNLHAGTDTGEGFATQKKKAVQSGQLEPSW
jgi:hypothetical protein